MQMLVILPVTHLLLQFTKSVVALLDGREPDTLSPLSTDDDLLVSCSTRGSSYLTPATTPHRHFYINAKALEVST